MEVNGRPPLGATPREDGSCRFVVWAPFARNLAVHLVGPDADRIARLTPTERGYHEAIVPNVYTGTRYFYRFEDGRELPDPFSRYQPEGVHGPSEVVDLRYGWTYDSFRGFPLSDYVVLELHVGTFSNEGTFDGVIPHLDRLRDLGITAIEIMPVAQFPGTRNWGYDGVFLSAAQNSYGGPRGLQRLVDACHALDLAVVLDVVYNHLGPEGNYLSAFAPYFTDFYRTPWGDALNFDGPHSDEVRRFFIENALSWIEDFHIDALRLDAVHAIRDHGAVPFLEELASTVHQRAAHLGRAVHLIAESDQNDARLLRSPELSGVGLDATWSDDFHHSLHTLLTGERDGYYEDFGAVEHLGRAWQDAFVYAGSYSPHRRRKHGRPATGLAPHQFVVSAQNHDQVGNRMFGDRLSTIVDFESQKLAAGTLLLSPFVPMLFMGEEYGETAPFQYFTSHGDKDIAEAVRKGRRAEFASFAWKGESPDPQDRATFERSKIDPTLREQPRHRTLEAMHRELIALRHALPKEKLRATWQEQPPVLFVHRSDASTEAFFVFHFGTERITVQSPLPPGPWRKRIDSADQTWEGPSSRIPNQLDATATTELTIEPRSFVAFVR